eukprot:c18312_g1_i1.p1 GENE.c18312_g1_i1~~c18312_g1_i1.p1  ORF type:complete len:305 (-),score=150.21 c18312_g1_i1:44-937(-)
MNSIVLSCFVLGCIAVVSSQNPDFGKYKDCWSCTGDGWGWCPIARKCGGFANRQCGEKGDERYYREDAAPKVVSSCVELTDDTFDSIVDGSKHVLVEFFAPWCGHCKSLKPTYEKVCANFNEEKDVVVATLDATAHPAAAQRFLVQGYPTIKYFPKKGDVSSPQEYEGGRDEKSFVDFLNSKAGTFRDVGGLLLPNAGRDAKLDTMVTVFYKSDAREQVIADAKNQAANAELGEFYVKVMQSVQEKGQSYVTSQIERIQNVIAKGSVQKQKLSEFRKKLNVLKVFDSEHSKEGKKEL